MNLITAVMGIGVTALLASSMASFFGNSFKAQRSVELRGDREAIKRTLLSIIDCPNSVTSTTCKQKGQLVPLKRHNNNSIYIKSTGTGTKLGAWTLRAECVEPGGGVLIKAVRLREGALITTNKPSDFLDDPLTEQKTAWSDKRSLLFPEGVEMCSVGSTSGSGKRIAEALGVPNPNTWPDAVVCEGGNYEGPTFYQIARYRTDKNVVRYRTTSGGSNPYCAYNVSDKSYNGGQSDGCQSSCRVNLNQLKSKHFNYN